ncbi:MAG: hypothetical protein ACE5DO_02435 [Desulfobacterales bacterium]
MSFDSDQPLEDFVCRFLENRGAIIEKNIQGFNVLLPDHLSKLLQTPEFIQIDTDPSSESIISVNYGSPLLEKAVNEACESPPLVACHLHFDYLKGQGFDKLIRNQFTFHGAVGKVESFAEVRAEYLLLTCKYLAQSDEQKEGLIKLVFNLETGARVAGMEQNIGLAVSKFQSKEKPVDWQNEKIKKIIKWVECHIKADLTEEIALFQDGMNRRLRRDVASLKEYYSALEQEMKASLERPGLSAQLIQERQEKIGLLPDELARKTDDLFKKYSIRVNIKLCGAMLIHTPAVKVLYRASVGRKQHRFSMIYNPANKSLDAQVCRGCGVSTFSVYFCRHLHLLCPKCKEQCPVCKK